jgi:hypothetical protein
MYPLASRLKAGAERKGRQDAVHTITEEDRTHHINAAVEALRARMTKRFIDLDEAFAQLGRDLAWQTEQASWALRRARRQLQGAR